MNDRQKQRIRVLRGLGKGYKAIAKEMNLTPNKVRCYCRYHGLTGYASKQMFGENRKKDVKKPKPVSGDCKNCGSEIYHHDSVPGRKKSFAVNNAGTLIGTAKNIREGDIALEKTGGRIPLQREDMLYHDYE